MAWPGAVCQDGPHQGAAEEAVEGLRGAASAAAVGEASEALVCIGIWGGGGKGKEGAICTRFGPPPHPPPRGVEQNMA